MKKNKIGYYFGGYPDKRNIINIVPGYNYKKVYDFNKFFQFLIKLINKKVFNKKVLNSIDLNFSFKDFNLNKVDVIHFFNAVSYGKTPWITTFETIVPRFKSTLSCHHGDKCDYSTLKDNKKILKALKTLASDSCKNIIAMSKCNLEMQKDFLQHFPKYNIRIKNKLIYLHPPQELLIENIEQKGISKKDPVHFVFVGRHFFRKGGCEVLEAFQEIKSKRKYNFILTIISSFGFDNYATQKNENDIKKVEELIRINDEWINHYNQLTNEQVLKLMKSAHIGLLPTYADTFGYSILEFQASGCPVISTNVRAIPEINNNKIGWLINVPKNRLGEARYITKESKEELSRVIKKGLKDVVIEIMENTDIISKKGKAALNHIKENHSMNDYSEKLSNIYLKILS